jgi:hypothetical protein
MDNKFYQDEFEQFLQDEVKQHRMYPSDNIWKNIRTELHGYKAWPALTFISLFIITALTISTLLNNHPARLVPALAQSQLGNHYFEKIAPEQITAETFADLKEETVAVTARNTSYDYAAVPVKNIIEHSSYIEKNVNRSLPVTASNTPLIQNTFVATEEPVAAGPASAIVSETKDQPIVEQKKTDSHATADEFLKDFVFVSTTQAPRRNSKFGFQFYITPSTSYRRLSDEKVKEIIQPAATAAASTNVPLTSNYSADVNSVVRHKPAIGYEVGFALLYNMTGRLKFKTGVQLNIRQYYIETFQSLTNDLTTVSLINYRGVETVSFYSPYNNNTGYKQTQLDNKVYQLSIPLGIQWDVIQGKHFGVNTEASVQPTITLNNNTYLLSTDYKHYTDGNEFLRKWNINTGLGLNLTYRSGATSWQLGPQIRYQHLPTYTNLYPIKEYLMDYGIRLGFTRQIK